MAYCPTETERLAVQARLASRLGQSLFQRLFVGFEIAELEGGTLQVWVQSETSANVIERHYPGLLAVIVESVVKRPVKYVNISPPNFRGWQID